jgi:hypothetical protein
MCMSAAHYQPKKEAMAETATLKGNLYTWKWPIVLKHLLWLHNKKKNEHQMELNINSKRTLKVTISCSLLSTYSKAEDSEELVSIHVMASSRLWQRTAQSRA